MNAHGKRRHTSTVRVALVGAGIVGVVSAMGATWAVTRGGSSSSHTSTAGGTGAPATTSHHAGEPKCRGAEATTTTAPPIPLTLTAITPAAASQGVALNAPITVTFSAPVAKGSPTPTITPATAGSWTVSGSTMTFHPKAGWRPYSTITVTVPAGVRGERGYAPTTKATTEQFVAAPGSTLRLQQLLAELGYLPVAFAPAGIPASQALASEPTSADLVDTFPVQGSFGWAYPNTPASLTSQWDANNTTVITRGAVMAFEADHDMDTDGSPGPGVWNTLLQSVATHAPASHAYNYLMVSKSQPESLQVWSKGTIVAQTLVNTGVYGAATADGTFPVFEHVASTTMRGTNPDGSKYVDPGVKYVAYFNGGDAVHEFWRPGYGYPQSNGCVELPASTAPTVWNYDPLGTLVTVS